MPADSSAAADLRTLADCIRWGASRFNEAQLVFGHGTDNALDEAWALALHALHLDDLPDAYLHTRLTRAEREAVLALFRRRIQTREPAPYLTGEAWFAGMPFKVDRRALVPRSPIAELIERRFAPWVNEDRVQRVLDIGTGSGCIAIACALAFPEAQVDAVDSSAEALELAAENVAHYRLEGRVALYPGDVFEGLPAAARYDLIVTNPPYVDAAEMAALPAEFLAEPRGGLAAGEDGLAVVRRILEAAPGWLSEHGVLVCEVGNSAPALIAAYPNLPFTWVEFEHGGDGVFVLHRRQLRVNEQPARLN
ncbi:MAG: 50S ribosomal protein L3 N(5)-glutamine methyltransferase [Pseudomonadota bacterium]|nr:50S ribosomal protein L3 N(5)-glutamine methyltransferase [Pseudomonadota bacterium]HJO35355.1 50S ribosomal protein L3 N(5)-glutamine methyltransferase [Gammaproteobacteria bacterium]